MKEKSRPTKVPFIRKIRFKLTICFLIPVFFIIMLGIVSYRKAETAISSNYETSSLQTMNAMNRYLGLAVDTVQTGYKAYNTEDNLVAYFKGLYNHDPITSGSIKHTYFTEINNAVTKDSLISNLYFISDTATSILTTQSSQSNLYSSYLSTVQGTLSATDPNSYYLFGNSCEADTKLGTDSTKYSLRLVKHFTGAKAYMIVDISYDVLAQTLQTMDCGNDSIVGLITSDGTEFNPNGSLSTSISDTDFYMATVENDVTEGMQYVSYQDTEYLFLYSKLGNRNATIFALIPKSAIQAQTKDIRFMTIFVTLIASIVAAFLGSIIAGSFSHTIQSILKKLKAVAAGDLTVEVNTRRKDEFLILCNGISSMIHHMREILTNITRVTDEIDRISRKVTATSDTFLQTSQNIKSSIGGIESGTHKLDEDSASCLEQMDSLSEQIQNVSNNTAKITELTSSTSQSIQIGLSSVEKLNQSAHSTFEINKAMISSIEVLAEKSQSISNIINSINSIAEETSLLSLNASIEAARAGEAGRGFTVVAEQIKKLASQSINASARINDIIQEILMNTEEVVNVARESESTVSVQEEVVSVTANSFHDINEHVTQLLSALSINSANMNSIEQDRITTLASVESISSISTETALVTTHVNTTTNEQLSAIQNLEVEVNAMQQLSKQLTEAMSGFHI